MRRQYHDCSSAVLEQDRAKPSPAEDFCEHGKVCEGRYGVVSENVIKLEIHTVILFHTILNVQN